MTTERTDAKPRLILASGSPRRATLMTEHGYKFDIIHPPHEEPRDFGVRLAPAEVAEAISRFKAEGVATLVSEGLILSGDTIAALDGRIFGKPIDRDDARAILSAISGTTHEVISGVTLLNAATGDIVVRHATTAVIMRELSNEELEAYLDTNAWEGKAGAYGIQDKGDAFVERIEGSFSNVVGFPMELVTTMLAASGVTSYARTS